ncbi:hypothetical protein [Hymenobacter edaphi]|uniref:hypothetical protein n=1 Tax=Hymenobacter edaphi TaxID=2211146 RepID=UPI001057FD20|nr:hypothetical protein [Hymenobacter edaphi]
MHITPRPAPYTRAIFERRFNILREMAMNGRIHISPEADGTIESLGAIRAAPNQRYNLLTINEMARATAMSVDSFASRADEDLPSKEAGSASITK